MGAFESGIEKIYYVNNKCEIITLNSTSGSAWFYYTIGYISARTNIDRINFDDVAVVVVEGGVPRGLLSSNAQNIKSSTRLVNEGGYILLLPRNTETVVALNPRYEEGINTERASILTVDKDGNLTARLLKML